MEENNAIIEKTITLSNGKELNVTIITEYDGSTTIDCDKELTEEEANELINLC